MLEKGSSNSFSHQTQKSTINEGGLTIDVLSSCEQSWRPAQSPIILAKESKVCDLMQRQQDDSPGASCCSADSSPEIVYCSLSKRNNPNQKGKKTAQISTPRSYYNNDSMQEEASFQTRPDSAASAEDESAGLIRPKKLLNADANKDWREVNGELDPGSFQEQKNKAPLGWFPDTKQIVEERHALNFWQMSETSILSCDSMSPLEMLHSAGLPTEAEKKKSDYDFTQASQLLNDTEIQQDQNNSEADKFKPTSFQEFKESKSDILTNSITSIDLDSFLEPKQNKNLSDFQPTVFDYKSERDQTEFHKPIDQELLETPTDLHSQVEILDQQINSLKQSEDEIKTDFQLLSTPKPQLQESSPSEFCNSEPKVAAKSVIKPPNRRQSRIQMMGSKLKLGLTSSISTKTNLTVQTTSQVSEQSTAGISPFTLQVDKESQSKNQRQFADFFNHQIDKESFFGNGCSASVYSCQRIEQKEPNPQEKLVVKIYDTTDDGHRKSALNEVEILKTLQNPLVVGYEDFFEDQQNNKAYLVMQEAGQTTLEDFVKKKDGKLEESQIKSICKQMLQAVDYLNSKEVCHRDIKPDNFMISNCNDRNVDIKLIDFNVSQIYKNCEHGKQMTGGTGLKQWSAPETRLKLHYGPEVDNWSIGCVLYFILTEGKEPFCPTKSLTQAHKELMAEIQEKDFGFGENDTNIKQLLEGLLSFEPEKRLSCTQALEMAWFKSQ